MRRPALATLALSLLALLFGWETRQAMRTTPGGQDNAAAARTEFWQPGLPTPDPQPPPDPGPFVSAITARPLFRQDRQPFREQTATASVRNYEAELSRYTLLGVLGFGDAPFAVVVGKIGNKGERWEVKKGDAFQGFRVEEVGVEGLRLTADGKEFLLPLYAGAPTATGGAVRTDTTRRGAAPVSASGATPRRQAVPSASPLASRLRRNPAVPMVPGLSRSPLPYGNPPAAGPRYVPGKQ